MTWWLLKLENVNPSTPGKLDLFGELLEEVGMAGIACWCSASSLAC